MFLLDNTGSDITNAVSLELGAIAASIATIVIRRRFKRLLER